MQTIQNTPHHKEVEHSFSPKDVGAIRSRPNPIQWIKRLINRLKGKQTLPPGIVIGKNVHIGDCSRFDWSHGRHITICDNVTIAPGVRILCHDASSNRHIGATWVAPVTVCERAFIGAEAVLMPGVTIGEDSIVATGAVVTRNVAPGSIVAGVPAKQIGLVSELNARRKADIETFPIFSALLCENENITPELEAELRAAIHQHGGFYLR